MKIDFDIDNDAFTTVKMLQEIYDTTGYRVDSGEHFNSIFKDHEMEHLDYEIVFDEEKECYCFIVIGEDDDGEDEVTFLVPF